MAPTVSNCSASNIVIATSIDFYYKYVSLIFLNATSSTNLTINGVKVLS